MSTTLQISSKETEPKLIIISRERYEIKYNEEQNHIHSEYYGVWKKSTEIPEFENDWNNLLNNVKPDFTLLSDLSTFRQPSEEIRKLLIDNEKLLLNKGLKSASEVYKSLTLKTISEVISIESGLNKKKKQFVSIKNAQKWIN